MSSTFFVAYFHISHDIVRGSLAERVSWVGSTNAPAPFATATAFVYRTIFPL